MFLLHRAGVLHKALYYVPVHKRLAAKKVNLKVSACARIFNKKIKRSLSDLKGHKRTVAVVLALAREAV